MKRLEILLTLMGCATLVSASEEAQVVSMPVNLTESAEYVNPVIFGDYSDPDVVASHDGSCYYMTASSFACAPGLPILRSYDLVNWELVNYAISAVPPADVYGKEPRHGKGVWAPCIRVHNGEYYIYWGDPDFGVFMVKSADPEGEWSEPLLVKPGKGLIDTSPLWDDDGKVYLVNGWAGSRSGFNSVITVSEMNADGTRVTGRPVVVFDGNDGVNHTVEGPKFYKRDGWYYILAPAGGVENGWQLAMRSRNVYGPYESRIVMAQGNTDINGPHQGGWVETPGGEGWFLHFQDAGPYGRIVHLNPLEWKEGWPVIGSDPDGDGCGEPLRRFRRPAVAPAPRKPNFSKRQGHSLFSWHANYNDLFGFELASGAQRIYSHRLSTEFVNLWEVPNMWLEKMPAEEFTMISKVKISAKAKFNDVASGLIVMGLDYCAVEARKMADGFIIEVRRCADAEKGKPESIAPVCTLAPSRRFGSGSYDTMELNLMMRVEVSRGAVCRFAVSADGGNHWIPCGEPFTAREGKWIGAKMGFFSVMPVAVSNRGWIDVEEVMVE